MLCSEICELNACSAIYRGGLSASCTYRLNVLNATVACLGQPNLTGKLAILTPYSLKVLKADLSVLTILMALVKCH